MPYLSGCSSTASSHARLRRADPLYDLGSRHSTQTGCSSSARRFILVSRATDRATIFSLRQRYQLGRKLFPFANASFVTRHLPAEMTDVRQTLSVDTLLKSWKCGHIYKLQTGVIFSCGPAARWCQARMMGAMDRMFSVISSVPTQFLRDKWAKRWNTSEPVTAIWHIRTGDITLPLRRSAAALIKHTIDKSFPRRGVRHVRILKTTFPWFESDLSIHEVLDGKKLADDQAFEMMLQAEVVVSTGSSFAHIPTGLAEPGRQIHMYLPPQNMIEMRGADVCCMSNSCECEGSLICPGNSTPLSHMAPPSSSQRHKPANSIT